MTPDALAAAQRVPSANQLRTFALLSVLYAAITAALVPWAGEPGLADPAIVLIYGTGILAATFCTAILLGGLYRRTGRQSLLVLACAYVYGGAMAGMHMATFPGALSLQPLFGDEQTVAWLSLAWRLGTAGLFLAAVLQAASGRPVHQERRKARFFAACLLTVAAVAVLAAVAARLPLGELVGDPRGEVGDLTQWIALALCAVAVLVLWRKKAFGDLLYLWLGLVLVASMADLALANAGGAPFTLGWHASRANLLVASCLLLAFLLGDHFVGQRTRGATVAAYGGAVAVTLASLFLRWSLDPWLGEELPYVALYGAVAVGVWLGGLGPAVLAMVLGYVLINLRYVSPVGTVAFTGPSDVIELALFTLSGSLVIVLGEAMRLARDRSRGSEIELQRRAWQLQRADENKSRFLAVLSHELRNPLAPLRTGLALLRMRQADRAAVAETHDMMDRQIAQLSRLIDDLLDVSRIDRGKLELRTQRLDINGMLKTAVDTARPNIDAKGHALAVRYPAEPLYVEGDPVRLAQAVSNLLNNAAKFTPPNGRIELSAHAEAGRVALRVADSGIGIAPEQLPEVFDMFVQLDEGTVAAPGGLGLGLTLTRAIVLRHGGHIEARSPGPGKGAEFIVRLPLAGAPAATPSKGPVQAAPPPVRRRVLVVDDNVDAAQTLAQYLRLEGHRVESALDGEAALRIAEVLHPDVAFIDLNMPRMDGGEVARRLRATPWGRGVRLIALTGMGQQSDIARTRSAGFDEHITKPADLQRVSRLAAAPGREA